MSSSDNITPLAIQIGELDEQIKALEAQKKALEPQLRAALADKGPKQFGDYIIEVAIMPGRKSLDKEALIADLSVPDLSKYEKVGKPFTQMQIKKAPPVEE